MIRHDRTPRPLALGLVLLAGGLAPARAATAPVLSGVDPPGGTAGRTVEWSIGGRDLGKARTIVVSGGGVEVVGFSARDETSATARVRIAADAAPGYREVRVDGPGGVSNLALVRVDTLPQVLEVEPNDDPTRAQEVAAGSAVAGVLGALDLDHFKVIGEPGSRLTLDLEARRLGTAIAPVVTVTGPSGASLAQGRESPGGDRECRMGVTLPAEGWLVVQVRDNTYAGGDGARYRLRVDPAAYATATFPLGGPRGERVEVEVSGGNLPAPIRKAVRLPDDPGSLVEVGDVAGPGGPVHASGRLLVGDGPERIEPPELRAGVVVNGRLARAGEVDSYRLAARAGEKVRVRVEAASLGSWLDSVLIVRDEAGAVLAENDDAMRPQGARPGEESPDSAVEFEAKADGVLTVEVSDRFDAGGPEYGYRLRVGAGRPDFAVRLLPAPPGRAPRGMSDGTPPRGSPGPPGAFNLAPGTTARLDFLIAPVGRPGRVEVRVEGLPDGVEAEPVEVRVESLPVADSLTIRVDPRARPGLSWFRVAATARPSPGLILEREAVAEVVLGSGSGPGRPITRSLARLPLRIVGESPAHPAGPGASAPRGAPSVPIVGIARTPVDLPPANSRIRPMIRPGPADK